MRSPRLLVDDQWLRLRADDCVTYEGAEIAPYYVAEYPDWVAVVALDSEDNIILVEQYRHGLGIACLELPGGAIDPSDGDPLVAGARELREETGFGSDRWQNIARLSPNPAYQTNYCYVTLAEGVNLCVTPQDDPTEKIRVVRIPVKEAVRLALAGEAIHSMLHIAAMTVGLSRIGKWRT